MERLDIDFGNGATKYIRNGRIVVIPAMVADVIDPVKFGACTVIECLESASGQMQNGAMFIAHHDAKFQAPTKVVRVGDVPRSAGKARYALHQLMAIVEESGHYEIVCSVPDPSVHGASLEHALLGTHVFTKRKEGSIEKFEVIVDRVTVKPEGYGAAYLALASSQAPAGKLTATLDIGFQTAIVSVFDPRGEEILDLRVCANDGGCQSLYQSIAQHSEVKKRFGGSVTVRQVEDAIRESVTSPLGVMLDGQSIDALYRRAKIVWLQGIVNQAKTSIGGILPELGAIVAFGGGVALCPELATLPKVVSLDDPATANVRGLSKLQITRPAAA